MTTPLDLISGALRAIGALESGETPDTESANDAFTLLNDMLAQWSNERMMISYVTEVIFPLVGNIYQYTIGPGGTVGATFTASFSAPFTMTVTSIQSGAIALGQILGGGSSATGARITTFVGGAGGVSPGGIGTYTISSNVVAGSQSVGAFYERPLRINGGFTRVAGIDYPLRILNVNNYKDIGLKALNGPWPRALYYQPSEPLGNLIFWPNPSSGESHLYCDTILQQFNAITDVIRLPQGYNNAIRYNLAELLMPEYGKNSQSSIQMIMKQASIGRGLIKRTNMEPQQVSTFDPVLMAGHPPSDAGWILSGGFN